MLQRRYTVEQQIAIAQKRFANVAAIASERRDIPPSERPKRPVAVLRSFRLNLKNVRAEGDDNFRRTIANYLRLLNESDEGVKVWNAAGVRVIEPLSDGFAAGYAHPGRIEINTAMLGYNTFCHELRHCWQMTKGWDMWEWQKTEGDAMSWSAARSSEAGDFLGSLFATFQQFDPITQAVYTSYYNSHKG